MARIFCVICNRRIRGQVAKLHDQPSVHLVHKGTCSKSVAGPFGVTELLMRREVARKGTVKPETKVVKAC
jgi:hypothetical protein